MSDNSTLKVKDFLHKLFTSISGGEFHEIKTHLREILKSQPLRSVAKAGEEVEGHLNLKAILNDCRDGRKKTCMHFAAARGDLSIFTYLAKKGGNVELLDEQGNNCLLIATQHGCFEIIKMLVEELKSNVLVTRGDSTVQLTHLAAGNGDIKIVEYLLKNGLKLRKVTDNGNEVDWAVGSNQPQMLDWLLSKGIVSQGKVGIAIMACGVGSLEMLKVILKHNPEAINEQDHEKWSLIHVAAEVGAKELLGFLIEQGLDVNYENLGKTAIELAYENEKWETVEILRPLSTKTLSGAKKTSLSVEAKEPERIDPEVLAQNKEASLAIKAVGNELFAKGEFKLAIEKYSEAIGVYNKEPSYYTNKAACLIKLEQYDEAIRHCQAAKKVDEKWVKAYFREGEAYMALKEYGESAASFWEGMRVEPLNGARAPEKGR